MEKLALRKELEKIAREKDISTHPAKIAALSRRFNCSLKILPDYVPMPGRNFNCYEYALGLNAVLRNSTLVILSELGALVDYRFINYLKELSLLHKRSFDDLQDGDLVIYYQGTTAQHAGKWRNGRVISKWGSGLIYDHELFEVPLNYGDPCFCEAISSAVAKETFLNYARQRNVAEEYLEDA